MKRYLLIITMLLLCCSFNARAQTQVVANGAVTKGVTLPGTGCYYYWTNNNADVGLPYGGVGNIPAFKAVNAGSTNAYATVTARPLTAPLAYIPNAAQSQINIINTDDNQTIQTIQLGTTPQNMVFSPDGTKMYVTGLYKLYVVSLISQTVVDSVNTGTVNAGLVASPDGRVYIGTGGAGLRAGVVIVNTATKAVGHIYFLDYDPSVYNYSPTQLAITPDGKKLYVGVAIDSIRPRPESDIPLNGYVAVIKTFDASIITKIPQKSTPYGLILNNDGSKLYNTVGIKEIAVTSTATDKRVDSITVGKAPTALVFSPDGGTLYVTNGFDKTISIVNVANKQIQTVSVPALGFSTLSITPDGKKLYIYSDNSTVIRFFTDTFLATTVSSVSKGLSRWFGNFIKISGNGCTGVIINYIITPTPAIATILTDGAPTTLTTNVGTASASSGFTASAYKLTEGIKLTAPPGFEVSTDNITFSGTITVGTGGDIPDTKIYVRLSASTAVGSYSGKVTLSSAGAADVMVAVSGEVSPAGSVVPNYTFYNGQNTPIIKLPGNGCFYIFTKDKNIGNMAGDGRQFFPFTATNTGTTPITSNISVQLNPLPPVNQTMAFIVNSLSADVWFYDLYNSGGDVTNNFKQGSNGYLYYVNSGGGLPQGIAFSPDQHMVYITNKSGNNVSVLRLYETSSAIPPLPVLYDVVSYGPVNLDLGLGAAPTGIAISPDGSTLYVANSGTGTLSVINTASFKVQATINGLGLNPMGVAISPDGSRVYVAVSGSGYVAVINTVNNALITTVPTGSNPTGIVVSADGSRLFVTNQGSNSVSVINTSNNLIGAPISVGLQPTAIGITPDGSKVYVANQGAGTVSVIGTASNSIMATVNIGTGKAPSGIGISPDGALVYVYDLNSNIITVINSATNTTSTTFTEGGTGPAVLGNFIEGPIGCAMPFNFTITVLPTPPTISATGYLAALTTSQGVASAITAFDVSALSLTEGVLIKPPPGFEVSADSLKFSPTITIGGPGNLASTRVYIRLSNTAVVGTYSGDIVLSSAGANNTTEPTARSTVTAPMPVILPGIVSGKILACTGTPSASPFIQQVKISTVALNGVLSVAASSDFEVSLSPNGVFAQVLDITIPPATPDLTLYIRSSATAKGRVANNLKLSSPGAETKTVYVYGVAAIYPTINPVASQTVVAGAAPTKTITFSGSGANTYNWFNDNNLTGLDISGTGDIPSFIGLNNTNSPIISTIKAYPVSIPLAYVADQGGNAVSVINIATNTLIANVTVGSSPRALVLNEDATLAYIANFGTDDVSVLNTATNTIIATVKVAESPVNLELNADGTQVLVFSVNQAGSFVSAINTADNTLAYSTKANSIYTPGTIRSPDGTRAYVYSYGGFTFTVYDLATNKMITSVGANTSPGGMALSPDGSIIYAANGDAGTLMVIDAKTFQKITTINLGANTYPRGVSISLDGKTLYVANGNTNTIAIVDATTYEIINTLNTGNFPLASVTTGGTGCSGQPATFTITVEPVPPIIVATGVLDSLGTIQGNPSLSTKFTVSGTRMKEGIKATAPAGFEVSIDNVNFATSVTFGAAGTIANTIVYTRLAASTLVGNYHGDIILSSQGATNDTVATYKSNNVTEPVSSVVAGFVTGNIAACAGSPSVSPNIKQFKASGYLLTSDITVTAPKGFEVSVNALTGYAGSLTLARIAGDSVPHTTIYVRSAASALGAISGNVSLSASGATTRNAAVTGVVSPLPAVNQVQDQALPGGQTTAPVTFTGTGNTYSWTNSNTNIGLPAAGFGNIASFTAINKTGTPAVANVSVTPIAAALAYVANSQSNSVSVINTGTNTVVNTISLLNNSIPYAIAISPDGRRIYTANQGSSTVSEIDAISNLRLKDIALGTKKNPYGIVISPDGSTLYTCNGGSNDVSVIDIASGNVSNILVGTDPEGIVISPDGSTLYVTNRNALPGKPAVSVIDTKRKLVTGGFLLTTKSPQNPTISPDGSTLYVSNYGSANVSAINTTSGTSVNIAVGVNPAGLVVSADGKTLYVANNGSNTVSVINTVSNTLATSINLGYKNPAGVSLTPDGSKLYVVNTGSRTVSIINTTTNQLAGDILSLGGSPVSYGNFISAGTGCTGNIMTFKITVNPSSPYITTTGTLAGLNTSYGTASSSQSFSVSGISMTAGITVNPPIGFEVSTDNKTFGATVSFGAAGVINATTVYIRLAATTAVGKYTGDITVTSPGAADAPVAMPLSIVSAIPLTITADNKSKTAGAANPILTANYSGFVNGDTKAQLTTLPVLTTTATQASPVGQYPIEVSGAVSTNYTFIYIPGILTVNLGEQTIAIPNTFTPNGDGVNDTWQIPALATYTNFTVSIYNRLGQSLYYSANYPIPWDGTYNGAPLPAGVYYYIINIKGASKPFAGSVTIIR